MSHNIWKLVSGFLILFLSHRRNVVRDSHLGLLHQGYVLLIRWRVCRRGWLLLWCRWTNNLMYCFERWHGAALIHCPSHTHCRCQLQEFMIAYFLTTTARHLPRFLHVVVATEALRWRGLVTKLDVHGVEYTALCWVDCSCGGALNMQDLIERVHSRCSLRVLTTTTCVIHGFNGHEGA